MTERLILHIEVPEVNVEGFREVAKEFDMDLLYIVLEEMMRPQVGVTFVTQPGEKCLNSEFDIFTKTCTVVGVEIREEAVSDE
jgi:hypothetical protein